MLLHCSSAFICSPSLPTSNLDSGHDSRAASDLALVTFLSSSTIRHSQEHTKSLSLKLSANPSLPETSLPTDLCIIGFLH